MQVIATAGHVDHGKSALVRALTGMEPDRWAEERRRGMTIDLGFAWMSLPSGETLSFVDVPGHERFITNMLAGVGPAPAVCLVVAANDGWQPQTEEHVRALDAFGVTRGLVVVTKTDLADPAPVRAAVRRRLAATSLREVGAVAVSAQTGAGMPALVAALERLAGEMSADAAPDDNSAVRLWIDRAFTIHGAGTVVTATLPAGSIALGDTLTLAGPTASYDVGVRGLQVHGQPRQRVDAVNRVAVNLRGVARGDVARGMALVTPGAWTVTSEVGVQVDDEIAGDLLAHVGSAAVPVRRRRVTPGVSRLRLAQAVPLRAGDRLLLRDPAGRRIVGATVVDVAPARRASPAHRATMPKVADQLVEPSERLREFLDRLDRDPWAGLGGDGVEPGELSAAVRAGYAVRLAPGIYVAAKAPAKAVAVLADLPQPFTVSSARQALGSTRRVVVPLLEHLDATRWTRRDSDGNRVVTRTEA